ncbi:hypothetical protein BDW69DRAFT_180591 [Aspergillus filifer]
MDDKELHDELPLGAEVAADVARVLDAKQVPNAMMGWQTLGLYAAVIGFADLTFVVPDELIEKAKNALCAAPANPVLDISEDLLSSENPEGKMYRPYTKANCKELLVDREDHKEFFREDHQQA